MSLICISMSLLRLGGGFPTVKLCSEASCSYGAFVLLCFHSSCFLYFSLIFPEVCEDWQLANSLPMQPQGHCRRTSAITPQLAPSPALVFSLNLLKRREFGHCDGGECRNSFGLELWGHEDVRTGRERWDNHFRALPNRDREMTRWLKALVTNPWRPAFRSPSTRVNAGLQRPAYNPIVQRQRQDLTRASWLVRQRKFTSSEYNRKTLAQYIRLR